MRPRFLYEGVCVRWMIGQIPKMDNFLNKNHRGSRSFTLLNLKNVLDYAQRRITALACWALLKIILGKSSGLLKRRRIVHLTVSNSLAIHKYLVTLFSLQLLCGLS